MYQFFSFSFDAAVEDILTPLCCGAGLVLANQRLPSFEALDEGIGRYGVTVLHLPPVFFQEWSALKRNVPPTGRLRLVNVGGDVLPTKAVECWRQSPWGADTRIRLINGYGPTEVTIHTTMYEVPDQNFATPVPIGRPLPHRTVYVLDHHGQPTPIGVPGELHIGGIGVARGYLNRPELTAEKFIPDPFTRELGARLYKSGDLVRYRPDGNLEFLGRSDHQVKIRGFRIELGEIEAALVAHPAIREAVVLARAEEGGDKRLVAYLVPTNAGVGALPRTPPGERVPPDPRTQGLDLEKQGTPAPQASQLLQKSLERGSGENISPERFPPTPPISHIDLRAFLKTTLPEYMVPAAFVFLAALPLTPNGKIDRKALLSMRSAPVHLAPDASASLPQGVVQEYLSVLWEQALGTKIADVDTDFFALGGHSLLAAKLISAIGKAFRVEYPFLAFFAKPTIAETARNLERFVGDKARLEKMAGLRLQLSRMSPAAIKAELESLQKST